MSYDFPGLFVALGLVSLWVFLKDKRIVAL